MSDTTAVFVTALFLLGLAVLMLALAEFSREGSAHAEIASWFVLLNFGAAVITALIGLGRLAAGV